MAKAKEYTVKQDEAISDGDGGFLKKGDKFESDDAEAVASLKAKGLIE